MVSPGTLIVLAKNYRIEKAKIGSGETGTVQRVVPDRVLHHSHRDEAVVTDNLQSPAMPSHTGVEQPQVDRLVTEHGGQEAWVSNDRLAAYSALRGTPPPEDSFAKYADACKSVSRGV